MTLLEFAEKTDMDLKGTMERFSNMESLLKRFLKKFPQDKTFGELENAVEKMDYEEILRAAHTLKGVAGNLGFSGLFDINQKIVDAIRHEKYDCLNEYFIQDKAAYDAVIQGLKELD